MQMKTPPPHPLPYYFDFLKKEWWERGEVCGQQGTMRENTNESKCSSLFNVSYVDTLYVLFSYV